MTRRATVGTVVFDDPLPCPYCGVLLNGATGTDAYAGRIALPDDPVGTEHVAWNMCGECGEVGVLESSPLGMRRYRKATEAELARFRTDPMLADFHAYMQRERIAIRLRRAGRNRLN